MDPQTSKLPDEAQPCLQIPIERWVQHMTGINPWSQNNPCVEKIEFCENIPKTHT